VVREAGQPLIHNVHEYALIHQAANVRLDIVILTNVVVVDVVDVVVGLLLLLLLLYGACQKINTPR